MNDRSYSDKEVALILRRATELEEGGRLPATPGGTSLAELRAIAAEAGIDPGAVSRAAAELDTAERTHESVLGPGRVQRSTKLVPSGVSRDTAAELMRMVDRRVDAQGTVTEAVDGIRWSASTTWLNTQVALHDQGPDTAISVEERFKELPVFLHVFPTIWGGALFGALSQAFGFNEAAPALIIALIGMVVGVAIGNGIWRVASDRSRRRVDGLADELRGVATAQAALPAADGPESV